MKEDRKKSIDEALRKIRENKKPEEPQAMGQNQPEKPEVPVEPEVNPLAPEPPKSTTNSNITLTSEERALADRISRPDDTWQTITEDDMFDFSLAEDPYKLPPEAKERQDKKEFAFRFIEMTPKRFDEITNLNPPAKWWPCNSTNTPFLAKYCDPMHGGVQRQDQILMFKPWLMHRIYEDAKTAAKKSHQDARDIRMRDGVKEEWGEWRSGDHASIGKHDVVIREYSDDDAPDNSFGDVAG